MARRLSPLWSIYVGIVFAMMLGEGFAQMPPVTLNGMGASLAVPLISGQSPLGGWGSAWTTMTNNLVTIAYNSSGSGLGEVANVNSQFY